MKMAFTEMMQLKFLKGLSKELQIEEIYNL
jgi:hypothetical protein